MYLLFIFIWYISFRINAYRYTFCVLLKLKLNTKVNYSRRACFCVQNYIVTGHRYINIYSFICLCNWATQYPNNNYVMKCCTLYLFV